GPVQAPTRLPAVPELIMQKTSRRRRPSPRHVLADHLFIPGIVLSHASRLPRRTLRSSRRRSFVVTRECTGDARQRSRRRESAKYPETGDRDAEPKINEGERGRRLMPDGPSWAGERCDVDTAVLRTVAVLRIRAGCC